MHGNEAFSLFYEIKKVSPLDGCDLRMVRIKKQSIELLQVINIVEGLPYRGHVVEINPIPTERLRQNRIVFIGVMKFRLMPKKKNADRLGGSASAAVARARASLRSDLGLGPRFLVFTTASSASDLVNFSESFLQSRPRGERSDGRRFSAAGRPRP